ncbi:MAG TPA: hypothetical protein VFN71_10245, partial [Methylomirabilota bacterium]|nr:hypothetical protein [Methylomirabilota bacterium]
MARFLCIVRRDQLLLCGYLATALREELAGDNEIEIILDRRQGEARSAPEAANRRCRPEVDEAVASRGFAVVAVETAQSGPVDPETVEQTIARLEGAAAAGPQTAGPIRWLRPRRVLGVLVIVAMGLAGAFALSAGRSGRLADLVADAAGWMGATLDDLARGVTGTPRPQSPVEPPVPVPAAPPPSPPTPPVADERQAPPAPKVSPSPRSAPAARHGAPPRSTSRPAERVAAAPRRAEPPAAAAAAPVEAKGPSLG